MQADKCQKDKNEIDFFKHKISATKSHNSTNDAIKYGCKKTFKVTNGLVNMFCFMPAILLCMVLCTSSITGIKMNLNVDNASLLDLNKILNFSLNMYWVTLALIIPIQGFIKLQSIKYQIADFLSACVGVGAAKLLIPFIWSALTPMISVISTNIA